MPLKISWRNGVAQLTGTVDGARIRKSLGTSDPEVAEQLRRREEAKYRRVSVVKPTEAYVYVLSDGRHVKIGLSIKPESRMKVISSQSGKELEIIHLSKVPIEHAAMVEGNAHLTLDAYRMTGEWFHCSRETAIEAVLAGERLLGL